MAKLSFVYSPRMPEREILYSVVLRSDIPESDREILKQVACEIVGGSDPSLIELRCSKLDLSHPYYLLAESFKPSTQTLHPVQIPHHYVLLIHGDEDSPAAGFLSGSD